MTREQMIDKAVRKFMKRATMKIVISEANFASTLLEEGQPFTQQMQRLHDQGNYKGRDRLEKAIGGHVRWFNRIWLDCTPSTHGLNRFPGRVCAIRAEFCKGDAGQNKVSGY